MRSRDQLMEQWDAIRSQIANGHASDGPRLWFEGVLDDYDSVLADAERRADRPEIEVTPEMIAVGLEVIRESHYGDDLADLVEAIYVAMSHCRASASATRRSI